MLKYGPCLIKCFLQNEKILIFGEMAAAQRLLGFALYRKIPIYKKRTKFVTNILANLYKSMVSYPIYLKFGIYNP